MKSAPTTGKLKGRADTARDGAKLTLIKALPPRLHRLALALLRRPHSTRELQSSIPANNAPEYVARLRDTCDLDIPCERIRFKTDDGIASWYGRYSLSEGDRTKLAKLMRAR